MKIFISGGCKNGKSFYAQRLAKHQLNEFGLYYIATMAPVDLEDEERILRHKNERLGFGFTTIEQPLDIEKILNMANPKASFLLDSLTALLGNEMFLADGKVNKYAYKEIWLSISKILEQICNIVIVSDYIYSDAFIYEPLTQMYRKHLAYLDALTAKYCDVVLEVAYNQIIIHKGEDVFHEKFEKML